MEKTTKSESLYRRLITQSKELAMQAKAALLESKDKQKFQSAVINKQLEISEINQKMDSLRENIKESGGLDVEALINLRIKLNRAEEAEEAIKAEYFHLFGKELVIQS